MTFLLSFVLTAISTYIFASKAQTIGMVDQPDVRKRHGESVPTVGGLAIGIAVALVCLVSSLRPELAASPFIFASLILLVIGALDDRHHLQVSIRLFAQFSAAYLVIVAGNNQIDYLGNLFATGNLYITSPAIAGALGIFAILAFANALNMLDGVDGLAGTVALKNLLVLSILASVVQLPHLSLLLGIFASAVAAFLLFNFPHGILRLPRVFLGDAGSMTLGMVIALCAIIIWNTSDEKIPPVLALWLLVLPLADCFSNIARRLIRGSSPFAADGQHLHHLLADLGYSARRVTLVMVTGDCLAGTFAAVAWMLGAPEWALFVAFLFILILYSTFAIVTAPNKIALRANE